jgi:taurine transport system ATP-binding protein
MRSLRVEKVSVSFDPERDSAVMALSEVSLKIESGHFVVGLGASGCGKTTLLNLMAGFLKPSAGRVTIDERLITGPAAERGVVFQRDALLPWLNVIDNVAFGLRLRGIPKRVRHEHAHRMLELVGLGAFTNHKIWQLSGGMRQRVELARALTADPDVLFMDEPLGALDAMTREQMQELLLDVWKKTGKTIFFITHGIEEAVFLATDLIIMSPRPGRIVATRTLDFGRRYAAGQSARVLKSSRDFVATREEIRDLIIPPTASFDQSAAA